MRQRPLSSKAASLRSVSVFSLCDGPQLERIAALVDQVERPAGAVLVQEGAVGAEAFVIVDGQVAISRQGVRVATLGPGEVLGEMALLDPGPRSCTATCQTPTRLLALDPGAFHQVLTEPIVARRLL